MLAEDSAGVAIPDDATVFFFNQPFGFRTLHAVVENIEASLTRRPRQIAIVYLHPIHRWYLDDRPWLSCDETLAQYEVIIWRRP